LAVKNAMANLIFKGRELEVNQCL